MLSLLYLDLGRFLLIKVIFSSLPPRYHICFGLDTESGLLRIVVNGVLVVNEEKDYFRATAAWTPRSLEGKLVVFKGYWGGFWYGYRSTFSNMNIFSSMMAVEDMVTRTAGGKDEACASPGDYLRYPETLQGWRGVQMPTCAVGRR